MNNRRPQPASILTITTAALLVLTALVLSACLPLSPKPTESFSVTLQVDGKQTTIQASEGDTVQNVLDRSGMALNTLDRVDPAGYTVLSPNTMITVVRVREEFEIEETTIPFDRQIVRNESLPEKQERIIQLGVNGVQQITYRQVYEDGQPLARTVFKSELIKEPRAEIVMVGVQRPFTPISIPGRLVYLAGGNAWSMDSNTGVRTPLVTSGDLDG